VLAGVAVALAIQLILNLLGIGIGIGAASFNPATSDNPSATTFSITAGVWWAVSGILAALAGGYTAGRLAGQPKESSGAWHGFTTWAFTTLLVFYLLGSTVGSVIGGAFSALGSAASGMAQTLGSTAQTAVQAAAPTLAQRSDPFSSIERSVRDASGSDPAALRDAAVSAVRALVSTDPQQQQDARERAAQAIAKAQNIPIDQAGTQVSQYEQQYRQTVQSAKDQATKAAESTTKVVSRGALFGSIALILGALAGWFGGRMGAVDPTITSAALMSTQRRIH
jgi:hypothetical protein